MLFKKLGRKKILLLVVLLFLFLSLASAFYLSQRSQETRKEAAPSEKLKIGREDDSLKKEFSDNYPLSINKPIYSFTIDGNIDLKTNKSFIRVVLVDKNNNEYLVYEAYPLITDNYTQSFTNTCDETCVLDTTPVSLKVSGYRTSFTINKISSINNKDEVLKKIKSPDIAQEQQRLKREKDNIKIQKININTKRIGQEWTAAETSVSKMTYAQKKKLFNHHNGTPVEYLPNLQGFEYYKGGVFEIPSDEESTTAKVSQSSSSPYPVRWDWRKAHGENWNTPVRDQLSSPTCWAYAHVGAMESLINLNFNQHLDVDLSEQMLIDCVISSELPLGMSLRAYTACDPFFDNWCWGNLYCVDSIHGLADENCDFFNQSRHDDPLNCNYTNICNDWSARTWKITDFHDYSVFSRPGEDACIKYSLVSEDDLKKVLIEKGPMAGGISSWNHSMVLEGYDTDSDNQIEWIFKNSWGGTEWGDKGYIRLKAPVDDLFQNSLPIGPVVPPSDHSYWPTDFTGQIDCVNKDNDNYCNWGISETEKPLDCPANCESEEKDCDDSNSNSGYFDSNFNCTPCGPGNCNGCCLNNVCHPGTAPQACGIGGETCVNCGTQYCNSGSCSNSPPPTPTFAPDEHCRVEVIGGARHVRGEQITIKVSQNPRLADNDSCYYNEMEVQASGLGTICTASGFNSSAQTQTCTWDTTGRFIGTYLISSYYGGHNTGCPDNPCCDKTDGCDTSMSLSLSTPTPTATPTPTPCGDYAMIAEIRDENGQAITGVPGFSVRFAVYPPGGDEITNFTKEISLESGLCYDYRNPLDPSWIDKMEKATLITPPGYQITGRGCLSKKVVCPDISGTSNTIEGFNITCNSDYYFWWNLTNTTITPTPTLTPTLPDLTVTDFHLTSTPNVNNPLYASVTYKNIGTVASPTFSHRFILNRNVVYEYFFVGLDPGEERTIGLDDRLPDREKWKPKSGNNTLTTEVRPVAN